MAGESCTPTQVSLVIARHRMGLIQKRVVVFLCPIFMYICQTCSVSLEILQKTHLHHDKKSEDVRAGTISFGRGDGSSLSQSLESGGTPYGSVIQSDAPYAGLEGGQNNHDLTSSEAALVRLRPKVQCTNDLMKFSAQGPGSSSLQLERGKKKLSELVLRSQFLWDCKISVCFP